MKETLGVVPRTNTVTTTHDKSTSNSKKLSITVLGSPSVGKTALTVRYLTGRYIGEYDSGADMTYRHCVPYMAGSMTTNIDIHDISHPNHPPMTPRQWECRLLTTRPDHIKHCAFLVVYSLADSESFENARQILAALPFNAPKYLAANQLDLEHRRQVAKLDGQLLAEEFHCPFGEYSAAEGSSDHLEIKLAFRKLIRQLLSHQMLLFPRTVRLPSISKLFGSLLSKTNSIRIVREHKKLTRDSSTNSSQSSSSSSSSSGSELSVATVTSATSYMNIHSNFDDDVAYPMIASV